MTRYLQRIAELIKANWGKSKQIDEAVIQLFSHGLHDPHIEYNDAINDLTRMIACLQLAIEEMEGDNDEQ